MEKIKQEKIKQGQNEETECSSQVFHEDEAKEDPKVIENERRVNRAKQRREEWIHHQVDELDESDKHDAAFRKGIYRGANSALHNFRGSPGSGRKPLTPFTMPKTPDNMQKRMRATAQGETSTDKRFHKKIADVERKKDSLKMKQGSNMHYTFTRNEVMRAQT